MANTKSGKTRRGKEGMRGRMPTKRSINLARIDENKKSVGIALPAIILIVVLAAIFSKFFVYDRLQEMAAAEAEVMRLRSQVDEMNDALEQYADVEDIYAHYTKSAMTADELARVDRRLAIELMNEVMPEGKGARSWSVSENILTIELAESTLGAQNELAKKIEESPIVDSCTIKRADKDNTKDLNEKVRATFTVYLKQPEEEEEEETSDSSKTESAETSDDSSGTAAMTEFGEVSADTSGGSPEGSAGVSAESFVKESAGTSTDSSLKESVGTSTESSLKESAGMSADSAAKDLAESSVKASAGASAGSSAEASAERQTGEG